MKHLLFRIVAGLVVVVAALAAMVGAGLGAAKDAAGSTYPDPMAMNDAVRGIVDDAPRTRHDRSLPTAVVLLGSDGANVADTLAPFEVLATSKRFNVYTAAPERRPVPLTGGLDLVPDFSFAELDRRFPSGVDVVIAPQIPGGSATAAPVRDLLERQAASDATVVGICVGVEMLADAGLLDGRPATSNWLKLYGLTRDHPDVAWERDVRYVDDGNVVTTAGVLSGIDGALRIVERFAGESVARRVATAVSWTTYQPGGAATLPGSRIRPADSVALLNVGYRNPTDVGVLLTEGVGEIELASTFRPYTELAYVARTHALTMDGTPIRSQHGLTFVPRSTLGSTADELDRLLVPGGAAAEASNPAIVRAAATAGLQPEYLHRNDEFAFEPVLRDIAETTDVATATWVAKSLEYQVQSQLTGTAWPWSLTTKVVLAGLVGAALATAATVAMTRFLRSRAGLRRFVGHYLEMVLAMFAGMGLLMLPWMVIWPGVGNHEVLGTLVMGVNMTIGMATWMAIRGHDRRMIVEMSAAMVAPFVLLLLPLAAGVISDGTLMMAGHIVMFLTMLAAMLLRRHDYTHHQATWPWHVRRRTPSQSPDIRKAQRSPSAGLSRMNQP
ncbi:DJ-1/PfpI family protein [Aeromicrobium sp.]|uniref:DJ-1/PfpI family protein n=1 Tax=Aeromicrobium sp. TaxID=1871063 RepID=UPI003D6A2531